MAESVRGRERGNQGIPGLSCGDCMKKGEEKNKPNSTHKELISSRQTIKLNCHLAYFLYLHADDTQTHKQAHTDTSHTHTEIPRTHLQLWLQLQLQVEIQLKVAGTGRAWLFVPALFVFENYESKPD